MCVYVYIYTHTSYMYIYANICQYFTLNTPHCRAANIFIDPLDFTGVSAQEDAMQREQREMEEPGLWRCAKYTKKTSMDWFVGENLNRKPSIFPLRSWGFPVNVPLNQSIEWGIPWFCQKSQKWCSWNISFVLNQIGRVDCNMGLLYWWLMGSSFHSRYARLLLTDFSRNFGTATDVVHAILGRCQERAVRMERNARMVEMRRWSWRMWKFRGHFFRIFLWMSTITGIFFTYFHHWNVFWDFILKDLWMLTWAEALVPPWKPWNWREILHMGLAGSWMNSSGKRLRSLWSRFEVP